MFVEEALRIQKLIEDRDIRSKSVLNIGSGDLRFRSHIQPYIQKYIILELEHRDCQVINLDLYGQDGIDIRLDIKNLSSLNTQYDVVICSNVFEHITDRRKLGFDITKLAKNGGLIIVTTPYIFPYHEDPIDTLFRPTIDEQISYLPGVLSVESEYLLISHPYFSRGVNLPLWLMKPLMLIKSLLLKLKGGQFNLLSDWGTIFSQWKTTYIVVQKV